MIKIHSPYKNLGCLGFTLNKIYFDFFKNPYLGCFTSLATKKFWVGIDLRNRFAFLRIEHAFGRITQVRITAKRIEFLNV